MNRELGVVCGIQARASSTRLPGKVLADLAGAPLLARVVERARRCALVDEVWVLTSSLPSDDPVAALARDLDVPLVRGPLTDVLARYLTLADATDPAWIVRVTGDSPLIEPDFVDLQLGALRAFDADLVRVVGFETGAYEGTLAGQGVLSTRALRAASVSTDPRDREHVGSFWLRAHQAELQTVELEVDPGYARPGLRLAVDEPPDLDFARAVFEHFGDAPFTTLEALAWLEAHPEIRSLHAAVQESADNQACRKLARETPLPESAVVGRVKRGGRRR